MDRLIALARPIAERLVALEHTVAVFESSAGGLVSAALLAIPGASAYYMGGGVVYTATARSVIAGVSLDDMKARRIRSSSEPYAMLLAQQARERFGTTWGVAETGAAGPTGNRYGDAAGHSCMAIAGPVEHVITLETGLSDRERNMWLFAEETLRLFQKGVNAAG